MVADQDGLALAPLDATDPVRVSVEDLVALGFRERPVGDAWSGRTAAGPSQVVRVPTPVVLRAEGADVLAWDEARRRYQPLDLRSLRILDVRADGRDVRSIADVLGESVVDTGDAVASLAALGLFELDAPADDTIAFGLDDDSEDPSASDVQEELRTVRGADVDDEDEAPESAFPAPVALPTSELAEGTAVLVVDRTTPDGEPAPLASPEIDRSVRSVLRPVVHRARYAAGRLGRRLLRFEPLVPLPGHVRLWEEAHGASWTGQSGDERAPARTEPDDGVAECGAMPSEHAGVAAADVDSAAREVDDSARSAASEEVPGPRDEEVPGPRDEEVSGPRGDADHRLPVHAVYHSPEHNANLGLGLIVAYARVHDAGRLNDQYDLRRARIDHEPILDELDRRRRPAIVLFSDYMWSMSHNLEVSAEVKRRSPESLTIHGGPHAPKYEEDAARWFADHPHVDVIIRGEGELTVAALLDALGGRTDPEDLESRLSDVEGLTFRVPTETGYRLVRTPDRARAADVSIFPSPYLTGEFDEIDPARWRSATVETNRGCPYGCTYCDWGSATLSRIRQFPLERVRAELEWLAARGISEIFLADANFGIFERDVEIADHLASLKEQYGSPAGVVCSFAKNTTKYTTQIVRSWVGAGMCAEGSVALQTTDPVTLRNVKRSNIKIERYDDLAEEFRALGLPIVTDLLMGLPGATVESFKRDLQRCIDREVTPRMMETVVLPNSPMNEPAYRERFAIETDAANIIVATSSFSREDFDEMLRLRLLFRSLEHYGLLRHLFRWLQWEHGLLATDLIHDIDRAIVEDPGRYPLLTWVGRYFDLMTVPPGGWPPFYDEVVELLVERHGVERSAALDTVLTVQEFLMPTTKRQFPDQVALDHDYVAWYRDSSTVIGTRQPLETYGPATMIVDDPAGVCDARLLRNHFSMRRLEACDNPFWVLNDWELRSDLMRPMATAVPVLQS